ncbi:MAG: 2Fe-2S iron-sulfur cluster-binding protein [Chloroflexota bacterium]
MKGYITASVFRYDPEQDSEPRYQEYQVKADEEMSVLVLLKHIQEETDPMLSFRSYCCGLQMCRSCLMKIDRQKKFACLTPVRPGENVIIEPATYPEAHVKDLVVKFDDKGRRGK